MATAADVIEGRARWAADYADALAWLRTLPDGCARICVTSPPYYGLRDYGTGRWVGGDEGCDHKPKGATDDPKNPGSTARNGKPSASDREVLSGRCPCGARRVDAQIGLEPTPAEYVAKLVAVFREVRRVLADDGTLWLNIGDSYSGSGPSGASYQSKTTLERASKEKDGNFRLSKRLEPRGLTYAEKKPIPAAGTKAKDLLGIPWMVAFALRDDGWYLRQDIIWHKPNPMPESVTDRCTKAHEYLFLLSKSARYYFDADAIREPLKPESIERGNYSHSSFGKGQFNGSPVDERHQNGKSVALVADLQNPAGANRRSVWTITTKPYKGAHFATFPPDLVEPCIRAGSAPDDIVLEPFAGSGTTLAVAVDLGRRAIGCELNPKYIRLIERRMAKVTPPLFTEATA